MKRHLAAGLLGVLCLTPVWGQEAGKPPEEPPLLRLVNRCVADGGLKRVPGPDGKGTLLVLGEEEKLKATARAQPALWTPEVRQVLVSAWFTAAPEQQAVVVSLLRTFGEARDDDAALGFAAYFTGLRHDRAGRSRDAIGEYTKAVAKFAAARDRPWEATALGGLGAACAAAGDYPKALEHHRRALTLRQELHQGPHDAIAFCHLDLGRDYAGQKDYADAQKHFEQALEIYRKLYPGPHPRTAFALDVLAVNYRDRRDLEHALECSTEALQIRHALSPAPEADIARTLATLGQLQAQRHEPRRAREHFLEALRLERRLHPGPHPRVAEVLDSLGSVATQMGLYDDAFRQHLDALAMWRQVLPEPNARVADCLDDVGDACENQGRYARALAYHREALAQREKLHATEPHADLAYSYVKVGSVQFRAGELRKMVESFEQAEATIRRVHPTPHPDLARYLNVLGTAYEKVGRDADALRCHEEAYRVCRTVFDRPHPVTVQTLTSLAAVHLRRDEAAKTTAYLQQALDLARQLPNPAATDLIAVHEGIAGVFSERSEYARSEEHDRQALALARAAYGDLHPVVASALERLAHTQYLAGLLDGDQAAARANAEMALAQWEKIHGGSHPDVARAAKFVGDICARQGDDDQALDFHRRALAIEREYFDAPNADVADCLMGVGEDFARLGARAEALAHCDEALAVLAKVYEPPNEQLAVPLESTAAVCLQLNDPSRALKYAEKALAMHRRLHPEVHPAVARLLLLTGTARALGGDHDGALADYDRALVDLRLRGTGLPESAADLRPLPLAVDVLRVRAEELEKKATDPAKLRSAEQTYALALALLERVRQDTLERDVSRLNLGAFESDLVPRHVGVCGHLFRAEEKPADLRAAYRTIERNRARVFLANLRQARAGLLAGVSPPLRDRDAELRRQVRAREDQIDRLEKLPGEEAAQEAVRLWQERDGVERDLARLDADIARAHPGVTPLLQPEACSLAEARACLGDREVALLFALGGDASWVVLVEKEPAPGDRGEGLAIYPLPGRAALDGKVAALVDPDTLAAPARVRSLGRELHALLLGPLADRIKGKDLLVVPDGSLSYLPFELLVEGDGKAGGRYLVEGRGVRYAPSLTALHLVKQWLARRGQPDRTLWAMGDPIYDAGDARLKAPAQVADLGGEEPFHRLAHSGEEVRAVGRLLDARPGDLLLGADAREARVKADAQSGELGRYRYVHFATHGILGQDRHQQPALVLSLAGNDGRSDDYGTNDGFLRLNEVLNLRLNADLVVLSACQSGRGRLSGGEGVSGLARAFLYAGSRGVVCSLWSVDDAETARLMTALYARLQAGAPAPEALREAQLGLLRAGKAPYYWAPFIYIGNAESR